MASIHRTTMTPTKLELITGWLPKQSWYVGAAGTPDLVKAGGFRLDDPDGAVGIEFMVVVDAADAPEPVAYLVPLGYRGAALEGVPGEALIGTSEHGVLGTRWVYDGAHDPVVLAQLNALLRGEATPQHQSLSDTLDPTVTVQGAAPGPDDAYDVRISRVLRATEAEQGAAVRLVGGWSRPDGTAARGVFAAVSPR
ncbi:1,4-alpha-glucan branching protein [Streptomyces sp. SID14515]|uniref:maltokinase N-terminal cap-like domain-containing protein n=1 Tax=Streptomyces sp. SID14515 TaxID=2706074 RepID=UPI0013C78259|nr:1,4-alpha-glucan branching protein [Streptomyces sp. SID14515]NEB35616.1 1,4-alpha-glucan branching protein [Streptomyces sp. SID14515]